MAGYSDLSSRAQAAGGMKRGSGPGDPSADLDPSAPAADDQGSSPDSDQDIAMQAALDAVDQGADLYGDDVAQEIRGHLNAIRELVSQGEATPEGQQDQPPDDQSAEAQSGQDTQGMESQTPATQATDQGGGFSM